MATKYSDNVCLLDLARTGFEQLSITPKFRAAALENFARWLDDAANATARPQIERFVHNENFDALLDAFFREIPFGTGGRRGPVGFGTNRINHATIATSIEGHCRFLRARFPDRDQLSVVVAYDVRAFKDLRGTYARELENPLLGVTSKDFACTAASVYAANSIQVWMPDVGEDRYTSTPELSFAIRRLEAQGGLNLSASHNHPDDNGAKIYNEWGSQEVPPVDEQLATMVAGVDRANTMAFEEAVDKGLVRWLPADVHEAYVEMNVNVGLNPDARSARVVFSPLHGTGYHSAGAALNRAGFQVELYPAQATPDGAFPNVPFRSPNPEVKEVVLPAAQHAEEIGADLLLATDPDADRIGMMASCKDGWVFFTGNEIGVVLAAYLLTRRPKSDDARPFAVTTVVTTSLFGEICRANGVQVVDDLGVGFKYIGHLLNEIEASGKYRDVEARIDDFLLGIEESFGFLVVPGVRDKDAAGAAVLLAELASQLKEEGRDFVEYLDSVYLQYGYAANSLVSTVMRGAQGFVNMQKIQTSLRTDPPAEVGGRKVLAFEDWWDEDASRGRIVSETDRMSRDLLSFKLEGNARVTLRPSGTESKNKIYVEVRGEPLGADATRTELTTQKQAMSAATAELANAFTKEMLSRIDISLPDYALAISGLVALECKVDFATSFMPAFIERLSGDVSTDELVAWIDERLADYGADGRLLVHDAVVAYAESEPLERDLRARLLACFDFESATAS